MGRRDLGVKECYICRSTDHIQAKCPEAVCYRCHKEGHIARDCPEGDDVYTYNKPRSRDDPIAEAYVDDEEDVNGVEEEVREAEQEEEEEEEEKGGEPEQEAA